MLGLSWGISKQKVTSVKSQRLFELRRFRVLYIFEGWVGMGEGRGVGILLTLTIKNCPKLLRFRIRVRIRVGIKIGIRVL